jgi:hypothetical protein
MDRAIYSLTTELLQMGERGQAMRRRAMTTESAWDYSVDEANTARLRQIVETHGWPTLSQVGEKAAHAAWLLVQHAPDLAFMKQCLRLMEAMPADEVCPSDMALLEDRILTADGKPQLYGSQFEVHGHEIRPYPIDRPADLDERRSRVGLEPFNQYQARIRRMYHGSGE